MRKNERIFVKDISRYIPDFRTDVSLYKANRCRFEPFRTTGGFAITERDFQALCKWNYTHFRINKLIEEAAIRAEIPNPEFDLISESFFQKYGKCTEWQTRFYFHSDNFFVKTTDHEVAISQVLEVMRNQIKETNIIPINECSTVNKKRLEEQIEYINHPPRGNRFVKKKEIELILEREEKFIPIEQILEMYSAETGLELMCNAAKHFKVHLKKNEYYGLSYIYGKETIRYPKNEVLLRKDDYQNVREAASIFLINKTKGTKENYDQAKALLSKKFPITCRMLVEYTFDGYEYDYPYAAKMLLYLNEFLCKEVTEYDYDEKRALLVKIKKCSHSIEKSCEAFLKNAQASYPGEFCSLDRVVLEGEFSKGMGERRPYDYDSYVFMAGLVFSDKYMEKNHIVEKMIKSRACANLVLDMQMHFISMWRQEDYCALGPVDLPNNYSIEELLKRIGNKGYSDDDKISTEIIFRFESQANDRRALKTGEALHLYIPKNAFGHIATSLVINELHRQKEDSEILIERESISNKKNYIELFGESVFKEVFGGKPFSNRRANHSYADKLSMLIEGKLTPDKAYVAYVLVGFARSHKGALSSLSAVTSAYLSAKTNGIPVNLFITEVFSRGYCGFALYMLLSMVIPEFNLLGVTDQTEIMLKTGLSPMQIENIASRILKCANLKDKFIEELFEQNLAGRELEEQIAKLIERIIQENCRVSKNYLCLKEAAGIKKTECDFKCEYCKFGLANRYCVYSLIKTYEFNEDAANMVSNPNKALLYRSINKDLIIPSIKSIKQELESTYGFFSESFDRLVVNIDEKSRIEDAKDRKRRMLLSNQIC